MDAWADRAQLADWRRRIAELYAEARATAAVDPAAAWDRWRTEREALFRGHPQSPVPPPERHGFRARHWPYDDRLRWTVTVTAAPGDAAAPGGPGSAMALAPVALPNSGADDLAFDRVGAVHLALPGASGDAVLGLFWMRGYAGGLFLPFLDATSGVETYGAGRYLLDTAKGADLGGDPSAGTLVVDLNFAFHPSCAFDPLGMPAGAALQPDRRARGGRRAAALSGGSE